MESANTNPIAVPATALNMLKRTDVSRVRRTLSRGRGSLDPSPWCSEGTSRAAPSGRLSKGMLSAPVRVVYVVALLGPVCPSPRRQKHHVQEGMHPNEDERRYMEDERPVQRKPKYVYAVMFRSHGMECTNLGWAYRRHPSSTFRQAGWVLIRGAQQDR